MKVFVRPGDTFWYYSQLFQLPLQLIIDSNRNLSSSALSISQAVNIPGFVLVSYQIQSGDSLWAIAQRNNLPIDALFLVNPGINPRALQIGQTIRVPIRVTWRVVNGKENYTYEKMLQDQQQLITIYPFIQRSTVGQSVMGKKIDELVIGTGSKRVHMNAAFHANEWITTPVLLKFLNEYLLALTNQGSIRGLYMLPFYDSTLLSTVPMVNPDGVNLVINGAPSQEPYRSQALAINNGNRNFSRWKANIRGVDLNNQYPAKWEIEKERKEQQPAPRNYPGERPLSEPEAIALAELTKKRNFNRALAFHTQGEVIFWGFENLEPPASETIVKEFARVSGYRPIRTVDSYAGYKDWFIQEWRRPGYTVELGTGTSPLPLSQFDEIYEETLGIFLASLYM